MLAHHPAYVGSTAWPDPDFLMTGGAGCDELIPGLRCPGMTDEEYRTEFSLWAIAGGQLIVATDVRNMSALQQTILLNKEILDIFLDPLGKLGQRVHLDAVRHVSVWSRPLHDSCVALVLLNASQERQSIAVAFSQIPDSSWDQHTIVAVRDLWLHTDLPEAVGGFQTDVAPHGVFFAKLCAYSL